MTALACHAAEGQLDPPVGPIAPTMKPLDAIEPRVCVNELPGAMDAVHHITEPGNYYLTADIAGEPGKHGVLIDPSADGAYTLDLNGFSLIGVPGSLDGVHGNDTGGHKDWINLMAFKHGGRSIADWDGDGIHCESIGSVAVSGIGVDGCGGDGIDVSNADQCDLGGLTITSVDGDGIALSNVTNAYGVEQEGINITDPGENGVSVLDCENSSFAWVQIEGPGMDGVHAESVTLNFQKIHIEYSSIYDSSGDGIHIENCEDVLIDEVTCVNSGDRGVFVIGDAIPSGQQISTIEGQRISTIEGRLTGVTGSVSHGISVIDMEAVSIRECDVKDNGGDGVRVVDTSTPGHKHIDTVVLVSNGGYGISTDGADRVHCANVVCMNNGTPAGGGVVASGGGIRVENALSVTVDRCVLDGNQNDGVLVTASAGGPSTAVSLKRTVSKRHPKRGVAIDVGTGSVRECEMIANGEFAIETGAAFVGTIADNHCVGNGGAVLVNGFGCAIVNNTGTLGPMGFISAPVPGNLVGPTVTEPGVAAATNPHANLQH